MTNRARTLTEDGKLALVDIHLNLCAEAAARARVERAVHAAREQRVPWSRIGEAVGGITRQSAQERFAQRAS